MASTYTFSGKNGPGATLHSGEMVDGNGNASEAIEVRSIPLKPALKERSMVAPAEVTGFNLDESGTETNGWSSAVAGCLAWAAAQWRLGQVAGC